MQLDVAAAGDAVGQLRASTVEVDGHVAVDAARAAVAGDGQRRPFHPQRDRPRNLPAITFDRGGDAGRLDGDAGQPRRQDVEDERGPCAGRGDDPAPLRPEPEADRSRRRAGLDVGGVDAGERQGQIVGAQGAGAPLVGDEAGAAVEAEISSRPGVELDEGVHPRARSGHPGAEANRAPLGKQAREPQRRDGRVEVGLDAVAVQPEASVEAQIVERSLAAIGQLDAAGDAGDHDPIDVDAPRARLGRRARRRAGLAGRRGRGEVGEVEPAPFVGLRGDGDALDPQLAHRDRVAEQGAQAVTRRDPIDVHRRRPAIITNGDVAELQVMNVVATDRANLQAGEGLSGFRERQLAHRFAAPIGARVEDGEADQQRAERERHADHPRGDARGSTQVLQNASPIVMW